MQKNIMVEITYIRNICIILYSILLYYKRVAAAQWCRIWVNALRHPRLNPTIANIVFFPGKFFGINTVRLRCTHYRGLFGVPPNNLSLAK